LIDLGGSFLALSLFCILMILMATSRFKRDLEP